MGVLAFTGMGQVVKAIGQCKSPAADPDLVAASLQYLSTAVDVMGDYHVGKALAAALSAINQHADQAAVTRAAALLYAAVVAGCSREVHTLLLLHLGILWARLRHRPQVAALVYAALHQVAQTPIPLLDSLLYDCQVLLIYRDMVQQPELQTPAGQACMHALLSVFTQTSRGRARVHDALA